MARAISLVDRDILVSGAIKVSRAPRPGIPLIVHGFLIRGEIEMSYKRQCQIFRTIFSVLILIISLAAPAAWTHAQAAGKRIAPSYIPQKRLPKQVRYHQAPAYNKSARNNRRLVTKTRRAGRQFRRTGSAYEDN